MGKYDESENLEDRTRKSLRRLALMDEISDLSFEERNLYELDVRAKALNTTVQELRDNAGDSDFESFDSEASRVNFWRAL